MKKVLYLLPRIISWVFTITIFVIFLGSIAIKCSAGDIKLLLIPIFLVIISFLAWKKPLFGGIIFTIFGFIFVTYMTIGQNEGINYPPMIIIGLPMLVSGILFLVEGILKRKMKEKS